MILKVIGPYDLGEATGEVIAGLAVWLAGRGLITNAQAPLVAARAVVAADELPRAERLFSPLYDQAKKSRSAWEKSGVRPTGPPPEIIEDLLTITRIAAGKLWFDDSIGPGTVPKEASKLDGIGWQVNLLLVKGKDSWEIDEVGNVYPS